MVEEGTGSGWKLIRKEQVDRTRKKKNKFRLKRRNGGTPCALQFVTMRSGSLLDLAIRCKCNSGSVDGVLDLTLFEKIFDWGKLGPDGIQLPADC